MSIAAVRTLDMANADANSTSTNSAVVTLLRLMSRYDSPSVR